MKKKALKWILGAAIGIAAVTGCCMYPSAAERSNVLPDGVMIEGMDMSGKTPEEALAAVAEMAEAAYCYRWRGKFNYDAGTGRTDAEKCR